MSWLLVKRVLNQKAFYSNAAHMLSIEGLMLREIPFVMFTHNMSNLKCCIQCLNVCNLRAQDEKNKKTRESLC